MSRKSDSRREAREVAALAKADQAKLVAEMQGSFRATDVARALRGEGPLDGATPHPTQMPASESENRSGDNSNVHQFPGRRVTDTVH